MNYEHLHTITLWDGVTMCEYPARGEMDPCYHDGHKAFKHTSFRREILDIRRPDGKKVFLGAIDGSVENSGKLMTYHYNDEANEQFIAGISGNLPMYLFHYLRNVKGYSERSILSVLGACSESHRLTSRDAKWDKDNRSIQPVTHLTSQDFVGRMAQCDMYFLLPEVMEAYGNKQSATKLKKKHFSDAAKEEVARGYRFKNKPGFNPTQTGSASAYSDSNTTTGDASYRSVTTADIQGKLPGCREELNGLIENLREVSCKDELFDHPLMSSTNVDELSLGSSASAQLNSLYKDTLECIRLLKVCLGELGQTGLPRRQVEAPALLPQLKMVVVDRCRAHSCFLPTYCLSESSTGGGLPDVSRVRQQHGNNARNGGSKRHAKNNATGDITSQDRSKRNQARAGRFRSNGGAYLQKVKSRLRAFKRGTPRQNRRLQQSVEEIDKASHRQFSLHSPDLPSVL
eukprot:scaffold101125_cov66-Cyclotella_meneghiniana.AAC.1